MKYIIVVNNLFCTDFIFTIPIITWEVELQNISMQYIAYSKFVFSRILEYYFKISS